MSDHEHQPKPDGGLSAVDRSVSNQIVAWRYRKPVCDIEGRQVGYSGWHFSTEKDFLPWWPHDALVIANASGKPTDAAGGRSA